MWAINATDLRQQCYVAVTQTVRPAFLDRLGSVAIDTMQAGKARHTRRCRRIQCSSPNNNDKTIIGWPK